MFRKLIVNIPVQDPPPVNSILWTRRLPDMGPYKARLTTFFQGKEYRFFEYEMVQVGEAEMQQAVAGITHIMRAADKEAAFVVDAFTDYQGSGLFMIYSEAVQASSTIVDALKLAFDLDGQPNFDKLLWFEEKG